MGSCYYCNLPNNPYRVGIAFFILRKLTVLQEKLGNLPKVTLLVSG